MDANRSQLDNFTSSTPQFSGGITFNVLRKIRLGTTDKRRDSGAGHVVRF